MDTAQDDIEALERQRLAAIGSGDVAAMAALLAEATCTSTAPAG